MKVSVGLDEVKRIYGNEYYKLTLNSGQMTLGVLGGYICESIRKVDKYRAPDHLTGITIAMLGEGQRFMHMRLRTIDEWNLIVSEVEPVKFEKGVIYGTASCFGRRGCYFRLYTTNGKYGEGLTMDVLEKHFNGMELEHDVNRSFAEIYKDQPDREPINFTIGKIHWRDKA